MKLTLYVFLLFPTLIVNSTASAQSSAMRPNVEIATDAFFYAYPLVLMELKRRGATNVLKASKSHAPMNQFTQQNIGEAQDILQSTLWFDVTQSPLLLHVSESKQRFFSLSMQDMWSEVFASPGTRTSGSEPLRLALVGPKWSGNPPIGHLIIRSPTNLGRILAITQRAGLGNMAEAKKFQEEISVMSLKDWQENRISPLVNIVENSWDIKNSPRSIIEKMDANEFFSLFSQLVANNPPHEFDWNIIQRMKMVGIYVDKSFNYKLLGNSLQKNLRLALEQAKILIKNRQIGFLENGWSITREGVATYGSSYLMRASVAYEQGDVVHPEDILKTQALIDSRGERLNGQNEYTLRFSEDEIPPTNSFWSIALTDQQGRVFKNDFKRSSLSSTDNLLIEKDGSITLYLQSNKTVNRNLSNWIPTPPGNFRLSLNIYYPKTEVLAGEWIPAPVVKTKNALLSE